MNTKKTKSKTVPQKTQKNIQTEIYIEKLNPETTEANLKEFFQNCGEISQMKILKTKTNKSKGKAFIKFKSAESLEKALKLTNSELMKKTIKIHNPKTYTKLNKKTNQRESLTILVRNISFKMRESDLVKFFSNCGDIRNSRVIRKNDGSSKGFGFVDFFELDSAKKAVLRNKSAFEGREVFVGFCFPKNIGGFEKIEIKKDVWREKKIFKREKGKRRRKKEKVMSFGRVDGERFEEEEEYIEEGNEDIVN